MLHEHDSNAQVTFKNSNSQGLGLGVVLESPQGDIIPHVVSCDFLATNNVAKYKALILGLPITRSLNILGSKSFRYIQIHHYLVTNSMENM